MGKDPLPHQVADALKHIKYFAEGGWTGSCRGGNKVILEVIVNHGGKWKLALNHNSEIRANHSPGRRTQWDHEVAPISLACLKSFDLVRHRAQKMGHVR